MFVIMFGGMCHYDDTSGLIWRNIRFVADRSAFEITFDKRMNSQFRHGSKRVRCDCYIGCGFTPAERTDSTSSVDSNVGWYSRARAAALPRRRLRLLMITICVI
jgi:hypothetical protein